MGTVWLWGHWRGGCLPAVVTREAPALACRWKLQFGDFANTLPAEKLLKYPQHWKDYSASTCELSCSPQPGDLKHLQRTGSTDFGWASPASESPGPVGLLLGVCVELCWLQWGVLEMGAASAGALSCQGLQDL